MTDEQALQFFDENYPADGWHEAWRAREKAIEALKYKINSQRSVQSEIIRCRDCDLWYKAGCPLGVFVKKPEPDYYCGTARRKKDDE